ncbi:hypothetical protein M9Y10_008875 [Tritrichomonas musculus]|uniref:Uncharacterized protein n=1 Tax=Tritrichomonas musculus TaxID=1915356 RepID=A0ABR2J041_9EUKA
MLQCVFLANLWVIFIYIENKKEKKNKKAVQQQQQKRVWKKRRDPIKAALAKKAEAVAMDQANKSPLHGGIRFIKLTEESAKTAKVSTKQLIKDPNMKIK